MSTKISGLILSFFTLFLYSHQNINHKKFVVIITSYNNAKYYKKNLSSVFDQDYQDFRVIYIDDASPDGTGQLVEDFVKESDQEHRTILIKNKEWKSQMANHYLAAHMCNDDEIIVHLDGDDYLAHRKVLYILNKIYQNPNVWHTYGQNSEKTCQPISGEIIAENKVREMVKAECFTHLRTFYAWLFKSVKLEDVLYESSFKGITAGPDSGFMFPIIEMSAFHSKYIPSILYYWSMDNPISQHRINFRKIVYVASEISHYHPYQPLTESKSGFLKNYKDQKADIIFIKTNQDDDYTALENLIKYISSYETIWVVGDHKNTSLMPNEKIIFLTQKECAESLPHILTSSTPYIAFFTDQHNMICPCNLSFCIFELERTQALGFFFNKSLDHGIIPPVAPLSDELYAWQFQYGHCIWDEPKRFRELFQEEHFLQLKKDTDDWSRAYCFNGALYRKNDMVSLLQNGNCNETLYEIINQANSSMNVIGRKTGLFFAHAMLAH